jgi:hypothetical protein
MRREKSKTGTEKKKKEIGILGGEILVGGLYFSSTPTVPVKRQHVWI